MTDSQIRCSISRVCQLMLPKRSRHVFGILGDLSAKGAPGHRGLSEKEGPWMLLNSMCDISDSIGWKLLSLFVVRFICLCLGRDLRGLSVD